MSPILFLFITRKALKSFMVKTVSCDHQKLTRPTKVFYKKNMCLIAYTPPLPKSFIYCPFHLPLWSSFSELFKCCLPGCSPHIAPNKI